MDSPSGVKIENMPEFQSVLREYMKRTKRTLPTILNTKGYYIATFARFHTEKVAAKDIRQELSAPSKLSPTLTVAEVIALKRLRAKKQKIGPGDLKAAAKALTAARLRSRGFLASGWLSSIKSLSPYAKQKSRAPKFSISKSRQFGRPKGYGIPARESWNPTSEIANTADSKHDKTGALIKYGQPPFERAWADEIRSMRVFIEQEIQKENERVNAK